MNYCPFPQSAVHSTVFPALLFSDSHQVSLETERIVLMYDTHVLALIFFNYLLSRIFTREELKVTKKSFLKKKRIPGLIF